MKYKIVSALMNIGREKSHISCRKIDFYTAAVARYRRVLPADKLTIYGNVAAYIDEPLGFSDLIHFLGAPRFDKMELLRASNHWPGIQGELSWYGPLCWGKFFLLKKELIEDPSLDAVYWADVGIPTHGFFDIGRLNNIEIKEGFHIAAARNRGGDWHGLNLESLLGRSDLRVCGGLFGGTRADVLGVPDAIIALIDACLPHAAVPFEEDFLAHHATVHPNAFKVHAEFEGWLNDHGA